MPDDTQAGRVEAVRANNTFWVVIVALLVLLAAFAIAALALGDAGGEAVAAAMGAVGTTIGALAGLVAGKAAGESGKDDAVKAAESAQAEVTLLSEQKEVLASAMDSQVYDDLRRQYQRLWPT